MRLFIVLGALVLGTIPGVAQDPKAEEGAIRALIERSNEAGTPLPGVRGAVFWSGAYKAPVMGDERPVEIVSPRQPANRVSSRTRVTVKKLEVSTAGDMAWEYSDGQLSYELKDGTKGTFRNATLRVWRKIDGAWRVVGHFSQHVE